MNKTGWDTFDFLIASLLLIFAACGYALVARKATTKKQRIAGIILLIVLFIIVWAELGVGLFNTPISGD